ncbi:hypothetical protein HDV00_012095, partial [Rhizophlyctis rosea]
LDGPSDRYSPIAPDPLLGGFDALRFLETLPHSVGTDTTLPSVSSSDATSFEKTVTERLDVTLRIGDVAENSER